ncbi:monomeric G-protein, partial [Terfezia claveryi]
SVPYRNVYKDGRAKTIRNPAEFPMDDIDYNKVSRYGETSVLATTTVPEEYLGKTIKPCSGGRGEQV